MNAGIRVGWIVSLGVAAVMVLAALPVSASLTQETSRLWKGTGDTVA